MSFDTPLFLGVFLPLTLLLSWVMPNMKWKNAFLLAAGLLFYAFGSLLAPLAVVLAACFNYWAGKHLHGKGGKTLLTLAVGADLALLVFICYADRWLGLGQETFSLVMPVGMSFFTFKCVSYLVDCHRKWEQCPGRFWEFLLYVSFFPQATAGPITRFSDFRPQLHERREDSGAVGLRRFAVGLGKKLLLAGTLAKAADGVFALESTALDFRLAWLGALAYSLQIYFDFSGYSDMAIGLGRAFGFQTGENFRYPYTAVSISDFWRRWHISLSGWFRDYVYIPLGGNRKGRLRTAVNKLLVFALCGLWHGASWTFMLWGLWHGLLVALESWTRFQPRRPAQRIFGHLYTLLAVCVGFVMFRAQSVPQGLAVLRAMFTGFSFTQAGTVALHTLANAQVLTAMILGCVLCLPWVDKIRHNERLQAVCEPVSYGLCLVLFALCLLRLAGGGFAPFIYAQF